MDASLATWEDAEAIQQRFLAAPVWGHAGSQGAKVSAALILETMMQ